MTEIYDKVVAVRFAPVTKAYYFDANGYSLNLDDYVIVESVRGKQIGKVVQVIDDFVNENEPLKLVLRPASPKDLVAKELFNQSREEALTYARKRLEELNLKGVKILDADFSFDGTRLQINYASDNDEKVDLKSLKYDLLRYFPNVSAVDLRQLGPRDVAKSIPGMGACGLACRCCCRYLTEFSSISIKMAKEQGISLTPAEITGMCGRLRCCLVYENDYYVECRKKLPKKNKRVMTPQGEGKVLEVFPLRDAVLVDIPDVGRREYKREQITVEDGKPAGEKPAAAKPAEEIVEADTEQILSLVSDIPEEPSVKKDTPKEKAPNAPKAERRERPERKDKREKEPWQGKSEKPVRRDRPAKKKERGNPAERNEAGAGQSAE